MYLTGYSLSRSRPRTGSIPLWGPNEGTVAGLPNGPIQICSWKIFSSNRRRWHSGVARLVGLGQLALVDPADSAMQPAGINCDDDHEKVKGEKKMDRL
jgi:hypothetical protein